MAETTRFGFEKVGGSFGGSIADNGGKYTTTDRDTFDKLLAFFETHQHDGGDAPVALASPTAAATGVITATGGTIPNGTTRYYKYSLIDQFGLESAASPELAMTLPSLVTVTDAPVVTGDTVGGSTLPSGVTYFYALTGITTDGETPIGPESIITVQTGQNQVDAVLPALPAGITSWNLWRMAVTDEGWTKVGATLGGSTTFNDTGIATEDCLCDPTMQPPTAVLAATGASSITITPADLTGAISWRLYESDTSGFYDSASLVAAVVPTVVGDPPPTTFLDTGAALLTGQPLLVSTTLAPSHSVAGGGGGGGGGADSHAVCTMTDQILPTVSGDQFPVYIESQPFDIVGFDIVPVYELHGDTLGDELQIDTDGVYSFFGQIAVNGAAAPGDQFVVNINWVAGGPSMAGDLPTNLGAVIIAPGAGLSGLAGFSTPPVFIPKGTRVSFSVASWLSGAPPTEIQVNIGAAMASGTPAVAEIYPAPAGLAVNVSGHDRADVAWTTRVADTEYHVLCYDRGGAIAPVAKNVETSGASTFTGLVIGHTYDIVLVAHKTIDSVDMFSTTVIGAANLIPTSDFFFSDDFNRANSLLGLPDWITGVGDPSGIMGVEANKLNNEGTGGVAYALHATARSAKSVTFTHAAPSAGAAVVIMLASGFTLGNPRCLLTIDPTAVTAPNIDYYDSGGTHTAVSMTAVGAGQTAYDGSSATLRATIHGDQVLLYQGGTLVAVALIPAPVALAVGGVGLNPNTTGGTADDFEIKVYSAVASGGPGGSQTFSVGGSPYAAELLPVDDATAGRLGVVALYGKQSAPTLDGFTQLFEQHDGTGFLSLWWKIFDGSESGGLQVYAEAAPFVGVMKSYAGMTTATGSGTTGDITPTETVAIGDAIFSVVGGVCATADNGGGELDPNIGGENGIGSTDSFMFLMCGDEDSAIAGTSEARTITTSGTTPTYSAATVVLAP